MNSAPIPFNTVAFATTPNFSIAYEDVDRFQNVPYSAAALALLKTRAQGVADDCEKDYVTLCQWFGVAVGAGFGPSNRIQITLSTVNSNGGSLGGAENYGYGNPSPIRVNPFLSSAGPDDVIAALVVSELSEILMSYHGKWEAGWSNGEGLSRTATYLLHPSIITSFYDPAPTDIQWWMNHQSNDSTGWQTPAGTKQPATLPSHTAFRQDWVSQTFQGEDGVHGDTDWFSFGCAILFIYYLKDQLGYSMAQIVQSAGDTLEERYQSLTGNPGGYTAFRALLDSFYPPAAVLPADRYDLFPLGGAHCRVTAAASTVVDGPPVLVRTGVAERGTLCGPGRFGYSLYDLNNHLAVVASVSGFGHPQFSWSINNIMVPGAGPHLMVVPATTVAQDPQSDPAPLTTSVDIEVTVDAAPPAPQMSTSVAIRVLGNPGQVQLQVDVTVTDAFAAGAINTSSAYTWSLFDTQSVVWESRYRERVNECWNKYITTHNRPLPWLRRYTPDPPGDLLVAARALQELSNELRQLASHDVALARQINAQFGGLLLSEHELE